MRRDEYTIRSTMRNGIGQAIFAWVVATDQTLIPSPP